MLNIRLIHVHPEKGLPFSLLLLGEDSVLCLFTPDPHKQEVGFKSSTSTIQGRCVFKERLLHNSKPLPKMHQTRANFGKHKYKVGVF